MQSIGEVERRLGTRSRENWSSMRSTFVRLTNSRSPANARNIVAERGALQRGRVPHQSGRPRNRNGRWGKARPAFGGCNVELDRVQMPYAVWIVE